MGAVGLEEGNVPGAGKEPAVSPARARVQASLYIANWMFFSTATILFNKWLLDTAGFRFPIILTTWHLMFATIATQVLAHTTSLLDSRHKFPLTKRLFVRTIIPLGFLFSASLILANIVYLYLSVAFIQMLKATAPVMVLLISWASRVMKPDLNTFGNILLIVFGVALASLGEIAFSWIGLFIQLAGTLCEAARLVMIQVMLKGEGMQMDPLVSLYYFAPVGTVINLFFAFMCESGEFEWAAVESAGYGILFLNAFVAFFLNVSSVFLIGKTSGLVMSLSGILKSIILVVASVIIWGTHITLLQGLGYGIALAGLVIYSVGREELSRQVTSFKEWASEQCEMNPPTCGKIPSGGIKMVIISFGLVSFFMCVGVWYSSPPAVEKMMGTLESSKAEIIRLLDLS